MLTKTIEKYNRNLIRWVKKHYWDSLEKDKDLILRHLRTFAGELTESDINLFDKIAEIWDVLNPVMHVLDIQALGQLKSTVLELKDRAGKAEAELAELREKVAWYFECVETRKDFNPYTRYQGQGFKAAIIRQQKRSPVLEMKFNLQQAESDLHSFVGKVERRDDER